MTSRPEAMTDRRAPEGQRRRISVASAREILATVRDKLAAIVRRRPAPDDAALIARLTGRSAEEKALPIPPADLRSRIVSQPLGEYEYIRIGIEVSQSIAAGLAVLNRRIEDFPAVLDWGCGVSRVLRHWAPLFGTIAFTGTDIDTDMIAWDRANVPGPRFAVNGAEPPLPCGDEEFDLAYGTSVFTHLDERMQQLWLAELRRVLQPGGVLLLSTHGPTVFELNRSTLPPSAAVAFDTDGFTYVHTHIDDVLPDWYQATFQTRAHVERTFSPYFEVVAHVDRGMANYQDLVICRKRAV